MDVGTLKYELTKKSNHVSAVPVKVIVDGYEREIRIVLEEKGEIKIFAQ